jgi:prepilin-type N-terminal cleavage/methylation domain-containing protein
VKSKSCKYDFVLFEAGKVYKQIPLFRSRPPTGFTLIEILVAVTIIATIVSMVYGSYFATAKSADLYKTRMTMFGRTRKVLCRMARQIRCSYIGKATEDTDLTGTDSSQTNKINKRPVIYFSYKPDAPGSGTLHLVTTHKLFCEDGYANGLFDIAYKFDKNIGMLYLSQRRFAGTPENNIEDRNWRPLLTNVESLELDFFDGRQWWRKWDFEEKRKLPIAVKIGITCEDENSRQCHYGTIAYVDCSGSQGPKILSEKSVIK